MTTTTPSWARSHRWSKNSAGDPKGFWSLTLYQPDAIRGVGPVPAAGQRAQHVVLDGRDRRRLGRRQRGHRDRARTRLGSAGGEFGGALRRRRRRLRTDSRHGLLPDVAPRPRPARGRTRPTRSRCHRSGCRTSRPATSRSRTPVRPARWSTSVRPRAPARLMLGMVQPVSQLGSQQITSGQPGRQPRRFVHDLVGSGTCPPGRPRRTGSRPRPLRTTRRCTRARTSTRPSARCCGCTTPHLGTSRRRSCRTAAAARG